jgi:CHAT domain-containing protein
VASCQLLLEADATRANVLERISAAGILHFSCHGEFNSIEPLESALLLAGDDTLTVRDLLTQTPLASGSLVLVQG